MDSKWDLKDEIHMIEFRELKILTMNIYAILGIKIIFYWIISMDL